MFTCFNNFLVCFLCRQCHFVMCEFVYMCMYLWSVCVCLCVYECMSLIALCRVGVMYPAVKQVDNWHHGQTLSSLSLT